MSPFVRLTPRVSLRTGIVVCAALMCLAFVIASESRGGFLVLAAAGWRLSTRVSRISTKWTAR